MMEGPRHQHLHQECQEPLEEPGRQSSPTRSHPPHARRGRVASSVMLRARGSCESRVSDVVVVVCGGGLAFGAHTFSTYYAQHEGQAFWGSARVLGVSPKGSTGGMRVLGVFENWAGKCVLDFDLKRPTAIILV